MESLQNLIADTSAKGQGQNAALISFAIYMLFVFALAWLPEGFAAKKNSSVSIFLGAAAWGFGLLRSPSLPPMHPEVASWGFLH